MLHLLSLLSQIIVDISIIIRRFEIRSGETLLSNIGTIQNFLYFYPAVRKYLRINHKV